MLNKPFDTWSKSSLSITRDNPRPEVGASTSHRAKAVSAWNQRTRLKAGMQWIQFSQVIRLQCKTNTSWNKYHWHPTPRKGLMLQSHHGELTASCSTLLPAPQTPLHTFSTWHLKITWLHRLYAYLLMLWAHCSTRNFFPQGWGNWGSTRRKHQGWWRAKLAGLWLPAPVLFHESLKHTRAQSSAPCHQSLCSHVWSSQVLTSLKQFSND